MGRPPGDYDIATSATPDQVMGLFPRTVPVGFEFGVVVVIESGRAFEVATFRVDRGYADGRHPVAVRYTGPEEDARRRDFTINGLFLDLLTGEVLDFVGGQDDIRRRIVRAIGDPGERFREDRLRLVRAVRFAARLQFEIDPATRAALEREAPALGEISAERLRDELLKIITNEGAERGLELLEETGLLKQFLPEVSSMKGVLQPKEFHPEGDVFEHTRLMLELTKSPSVVLALAVLLHDVGKPPTFRVEDRIRFDNHDVVGAEMAGRICRRLRVSNRVREGVVGAIGNHMRMRHVQEMREAKLKRLLARPTFADELELHRVDCLASHKDISNWEFCVRKLEEYGEEEIKPIPLVTGRDLIHEGHSPGPAFKEMLALVEEAQLENRVRTKEEAMQLVRDRFPAKRSARPGSEAGEQSGG